MTTSVPVPYSGTAPYTGKVPVTVPDNGGPFDTAYKAAGWVPPGPPPANWNPAYDLYGPVVRTDLFVGMNYAAHEAPIGLNPGYDWAKGARPGLLTPGSNQCFAWWCQFLEALTTWPTTPGGAPAQSNNKGVRIQVRYPEVWTAPSVTGAWSKLDSIGSLGGATYDYNFTGGGPGIGAVRPEPSGGWSFAFVPGWINHAWDSAWPRPTVPSSSAVFHDRVQIRITSDDPSIDLSKIYITGSTSNDWYPNPQATAAVAGGLGIGRQRLLTPAWQWYTYTGMSQAQLAANPPPAPTQALT